MSTVEAKQILTEIRALRREVQELRGETVQWQTARETGMTWQQLRLFRMNHPDKVKPTKKNTRSYLYNIQ
jgi:hypothetical protein